MLPGLEGFQLDTYGRVDKHTTAHTHLDTHTGGCCYSLCAQILSIHLSLSMSQSVSYAQFLYPTNALVRQKPSSTSDLTLQIPVSRSTHSMQGRSCPPSRLNSTVGLDLGNTYRHVVL